MDYAHWKVVKVTHSTKSNGEIVSESNLCFIFTTNYFRKYLTHMQHCKNLHRIEQALLMQLIVW